jgi:hypothetical protein
MTHIQRRIVSGALLTGAGLLAIGSSRGQSGPSSIPNGAHFPNSNGTSQMYSTTGSLDQTGPFFQSLGTNGRACSSCHLPDQGMSVSAAGVQARFDATGGLDPIFRPVDGANCDNLDVSTVAARTAAYSLARTRGLIRIAITIPAGANYAVVSNLNQYGCADTATVSQYRRPLPAANLRFLSAVMWDGRESTPLTGTTRILDDNYPGSLQADLEHQAIDATQRHAQATDAQLAAMKAAGLPTQIVSFETALFAAQATAAGGGNLNARGANGGPQALVTQPFFVSINSSVNPLVPSLEQPGGLQTRGDGQFTPAIFNLFDAWTSLPPSDPRAAIARGQALFASKPIVITGVAGINDDASAGGLVTGGIPSLTGTCGTCHDTPNVGNHSFPTPLNIGTGDFSSGSLSKGGLDIGYLPQITVCKKDANGLPTSNCKTTTDLGQAAIDGNFDHVGKIKGPILRSLSARAPYFHNGSAQTLLDVVRFYEVRFGVSFSAQEESDLVAFLGSL